MMEKNDNIKLCIGTGIMILFLFTAWNEKYLSIWIVAISIAISVTAILSVISKLNHKYENEQNISRFRKVTGRIIETRIYDVSAYPEDGSSWIPIIKYTFQIDGIDLTREQDISSSLLFYSKCRAK